MICHIHQKQFGNRFRWTTTLLSCTQATGRGIDQRLFIASAPSCWRPTERLLVGNSNSCYLSITSTTNYMHAQHNSRVSTSRRSAARKPTARHSRLQSIGAKLRYVDACSSISRCPDYNRFKISLQGDPITLISAKTMITRVLDNSQSHQ